MLLLEEWLKKIAPHHASGIRALTKAMASDPAVLAVIITGSIAKGQQREDSDIDFVLVVTDDEYRKRKANYSLHYSSRAFTTYPGGYVDGKVVTLEYMRAVAQRGNEISRVAFKGAFLAYCKENEIESILPRIPVYQKAEQEEKMVSFQAQMEYYKWLFDEAIRRDDKYLRYHCAVNMIHFGCRLILAHNEILYPYHKMLISEVMKAPDKPEHFIDLVNVFLDNVTKPNFMAVFEAVMELGEKWPLIKEGWAARFVEDSELAWFYRKPYIGDI